MHLLECVWLSLHVHLGGELLTLSRDHYFRYRDCSGKRRSLEAAFEKKADMWL